MDENYLYSLPKADVESFINTLEEGRNNPNNTYVATYMNTKGSSVQEVVDARTRLAAIENKEAIDNLASRVATMESLVSAPEYREVGKTFVRDGLLMGLNGVVSQGNGITAYIGNYLSYSTDGKTFKTYDDSSEDTPEGMTCIGFEYEYHFFRNGQMLFTDGLFFIYSSSVHILVSSPDLKTFTKIEGFKEQANGDDYDELDYAIILPDGDTVKLITSITRGNKVYQLSSSGATLLGSMNIELDVSSLDVPEVLEKFNNKYYGINSDTLYSSDDMLTYTEVPVVTNTTFGDIERFTIIKASNQNESDILIVSSKSKAAFTTDGETWENVVLPTIGNGRQIFCETPIDIKRISKDGSFAYFAILQAGIRNNTGIYKWTKRTEAPTCIYQPTENGQDAIKIALSDNVMKVVNNTIYFLDKSSSKYDIIELNFDDMSKLTTTAIPGLSGYSKISRAFGYNAVRGYEAAPSVICSVNGNLYIASGQSSVAVKQIPVYAPV